MRDRKNKVYDIILKHKDADLIAIGGLHTSYRYIKEFFSELKKRDIKIPVIIGGRVARTLDYMIWKKIPEAKIICKQEGEFVVDSICKHFPNLSEIDGIEYKSKNKIIKKGS